LCASVPCQDAASGPPCSYSPRVPSLNATETIPPREALDGQSGADGHATRRFPQERVQLGPMYREARPDGCPQLGDVDFELPASCHPRSRSITSTAMPVRASMGASANPAIPPPTISTRRRSGIAALAQSAAAQSATPGIS
jgi:hypothetical protein